MDSYGQRTGGWGKLPAAHAALVIKDEDFFRNYDYMWDNVTEWEYDRENRHFVGAGADLPARTSRHGSPGGLMWFEVKGRGDDWYDWDTNSFHFVSGTPKNADFTEYEPHTMDWHFPLYMEAHGLPMPEIPERRSR